MKWFFKSHKSQFIFGALLTENDTRISDKEGSQTDVGIVKLLADLTKDSEFYCRLYSVENFNTKALLHQWGKFSKRFSKN